MPKTEMFKRTNAFFAKIIVDSTKSVKHVDQESGRLILKSAVVCKELNQPGDPFDHYLNFTLDFQSKDGRARFAFEDLEMFGNDGNTIPYSYSQLTSPEKVEKIKPCLKGVVAEAMNADAIPAAKKDW